MANIAKTSIRFFNKQRVRARWDDESLNWWYAAVDLIGALVDTRDARRSCRGEMGQTDGY